MFSKCGGSNSSRYEVGKEVDEQEEEEETLSTHTYTNREVQLEYKMSLLKIFSLISNTINFG